MDLFWEMESPSSTNKIIGIGIFRVFNHFSRIWKIREKYKVGSMGDRAKPCPTPTSILQKGDVNPFQRYLVFLLTK